MIYLSKILKSNFQFGFVSFIFILLTSTCFGSSDTILAISNKSFNGAYCPTPGTFIANDISSMFCNEAELDYIGVEVDSNSHSGELILGLYENGVLIYSSSQLNVSGGLNELIGESLPNGIVMEPGNVYNIGLIQSTGDSIYFKTSTNPVHLGSNTFLSPESYTSDSIIYPNLNPVYAPVGTLPFNVGFHIEGTMVSLNTTAIVEVEACMEYISPSGNYTWNSSGHYFDTIPNSVGCDSIMTIVLLIHQPIITNVYHTACSSYTWPLNNQTYVASGVYSTTMTSSTGCDSTVMLNLTINQPTSGSFDVVTCDSYYWPESGLTYSASGVYSSLTTGVNGCDSTAYLDLTINSSTSDTITVSACGSYFWDLNQTTYTSSGYYSEVFTGSTGCDSTIVLDVVIMASPSIYETVIACDEYFYPLNGQTYTESGIYNLSLENINGCDTLVTLDLTVNESEHSTDVISTCAGSYTWIDGVTYTAPNNTATMVYQTTSGCDSIVTLNLTFFDTQYATESVTSCGSFTWDNGVTYTESIVGPQMTYTNSNGCDYVVTLDLTILEATTAVDQVTSCGPFTWIDGITYLSSNSTATYITTNANGCDSIISLNLTIETIDPTISIVDMTLICNEPGASYQWYSLTNGMQPILGATNQVFNVLESGVYAVEVSNGNCSEISQDIVVNTSSVATVDDNQIELYPNPSNGHFKILSDQGVALVEVLDMTGRSVTVSINYATGLIDASALSSGKYLLRIVDNNHQIAIREIVIQ